MRFANKGVLAALVFLLNATPAWAIFDAQVFYGQRTNTSKAKGADGSDIKGNELKAAAHLSPIPLVPIGFGASVSTVTYEKDEPAVKDFQGLEGSLEITAWLPFVPVVTPYAKLGYILFGAYGLDSNVPDPITGTATETKTTFKPKGTTIALGLKWSPLPLVGVLLEYDMRQTTLEADEVKVNGTKVAAGGSDLDVKSNTVLLGVEIGI